MHPNAALLQRLYSALDRHDHAAMAACYHPSATFHDIAFDLQGRPRIHAMWHMICEGSDIRATFEVTHAGDLDGRVHLVDQYTFSDTQRRVRNVIESRFRFHEGLIAEHRDTCDPQAWAAMAFGGVKGFLAGRSRTLRSRAAHQKLNKFIETHQHYQ